MFMRDALVTFGSFGKTRANHTIAGDQCGEGVSVPTVRASGTGRDHNIAHVRDAIMHADLNAFLQVHTEFRQNVAWFA